MQLQLESHSSPIGTLLVVSDGRERLCALDFAEFEERMLRLLSMHYPEHSLSRGQAPIATRIAIEAYFAGQLDALSAIRVSRPGTPFQRTVWAALREIPPGTTTTYGELAARLGRPSASRAVGRANGGNPIALVVPCHRVVGKDGTLTGYAGGLQRKRWLLEHEQRGFSRSPHRSTSIVQTGILQSNRMDLDNMPVHKRP